MTAFFNLTNGSPVSGWESITSVTTGLKATSDGITFTIDTAGTGLLNNSNLVTGDYYSIPEDVIERYAYFSSDFVVTFGGMTPSSDYLFKFMCAVANTGRNTDITDGTTADTYVTVGGNSQDPPTAPVEITATADGSGEVTFTFSVVDTFAYLGSVQVEAVSAAISVGDVDTDEIVYPGQSVVTTGSGFEATQNSGTVTHNGVGQTETAWADTSITATVVQGDNKFGVAYDWEVTNDSAQSASISVTLEAAPAHGYVDVVDPITDHPASVFYNASPTVVTGDQFEWNDLNALGNLTIGADGLVTNVDTAGEFEGRLWDATTSDWGAWATFNAQIDDGVGPETYSVDVPSADTYGVGEALAFTVNWSEAAYVTGTPRIQLDIGGVTRYANYASGDGTAAWVFNYTVQTGDNDANGIAVVALGLNGGTIRDVFDYDATLTLNNVGDTSGVLVDTAGPVTTSVTVPAADTYITDDVLTFTVNWNESVTVTGTPQLQLNIGGVTRQANYTSGTGTSGLVFSYTVVSGDVDEDGIVVESLGLNGGTLQDGEANNANLALNNIGDTSGVRVNVTDPVVASVSVPAPGTYAAAQDLNFTVNWSESVTVTGTPQLELTVGVATVYADYVSGSGTSSLLFTYTLQPGDVDTDGIEIVALGLNGGTIQDIDTNNAVLTLNNVGDTSGVLVDTAGPVTTAVNVPSNGTYATGQNLDFVIVWNEAVTVGGTPQLSITIGATSRQANYVSGTGSNSLLFRYTVQAGEEDTDGISISGLGLNGGSLADAVGNAAGLTLNNVGDTSGVLVDAIGPVVLSVGAPGAGTYGPADPLTFTVNWDTTASVSGTPQLSLIIGSNTRQANYTSGSGTTALVFSYVVQTGDFDSNGIQVGTLTLNGGQIVDELGNNATLALAGVGDTSGVLVDTTGPVVLSVGVPNQGTYDTGEDLNFTIFWDETVTVTGTPQLELDIGGVTRQADYVSGTGTTSTTFTYTVVGGDLDEDGIEVVALGLNGGDIEDGQGVTANLALQNVGNTTKVYVNFTPPNLGIPTVAIDGGVPAATLLPALSTSRGINPLRIGPYGAWGFPTLTQARRVTVEDVNAALGNLPLFRIPRRAEVIWAWVIVTEAFDATDANDCSLYINMAEAVGGLDLTDTGWKEPTVQGPPSVTNTRYDRTVTFGTDSFAADGTTGEALVYFQYILKE